MQRASQETRSGSHANDARDANDAPHVDEAGTWAGVRAQFRLDPHWVHLGTSQFVASHPRPVRQAIERHRDAIDANPVLATEGHAGRDAEVRDALAGFLGAGSGDEVALTASTTQGLGLLYAGLPLEGGQDVLTTGHEHFSHWDALRAACARSGAGLRVARLYDGSAAHAQEDGLVQRLVSAVTPRTRVVAVTWVQSDTGLKLPVARIARELRRARGWGGDPPLLVVDATHAVGVEPEPAAAIGADFVAGDLHKWMYGPRGTGFLWGRPEAWRDVRSTMASFTDRMDAFADGAPEPGPMTGARFTPGGVHAYEHQWAVLECLRFHEGIGREQVAGRVRALAQRCKQGLSQLPHVRLHTPMSERLSAGIVAFEVDGMATAQAMERLRRRRIVATVAPYPSAYLRFTPGIINDERDVDAGVDAVAGLRG